MVNNQLATFEAKWVPVINDYLATHLAADISDERLHQSMAYSVDAGGKRLRPLLTIATLEALGVEVTDHHLRAICALELVHTYSLIHDDLPAMDNDPLRRGKPSNHMVYGAGMATLAGDGLLTLAFNWLATSQLSDHQVATLVLKLSQAAGPAGMVAGQARDIANTNRQLPLDELKVLHQEKTGALLHDAVQAGLIMAEKQSDPLLDFADSFGLAFQIYDDILDVTSNAATLGKVTQKDADEGKNTYPNLLGLTGAQHELAKAIQQGQSALVKVDEQMAFEPTLLDAFFDYFKLNGVN